MITRKQLLLLGLITLVGFGGIGWLVIRNFVDTTFLEMLKGSYPWWQQVGIGAILGTVAAFTGWGIIGLPFMEPVKNFYSDLIGSVDLRTPDIIFISFCAGVGEEILFRGAVQPFLGIWPTAIIFVALHGYLNPMSWRVSIYGAFMTIVIAIIGKLYLYIGALSAFAAHMMIDVVLLFYMTRHKPPQKKVDLTDEKGDDMEERDP